MAISTQTNGAQPKDPQQRYPTDDFITVQGQASKTFVAPPLDGSLTLPMIVDFAAKHSPEHPWAHFPWNGGVRVIRYKEFACAMHRFAKYIQKLVPAEGNEKPLIGVLAARDQPTYAIITTGILRAGYKCFPLSSRNSQAGTNHLIKTTNLKYLLASSSEVEGRLAEGAHQEFPDLKIFDAPLFQDLFDDTVLNEKPLPPMKAPEDVYEVAMLFHSSGSTSFPKPVPFTHMFLIAMARQYSYSYHDFSGDINGVGMAPFYHLGGYANAMCYPFGSGVSIAIFQPQNPPQIPTSKNLIEVWKKLGVTMAFGPPSFLVTWSRDPEDIAYLRTLKFVLYSGGPLPTENGNELVHQGVRVLQAWGSTELGAVTQCWPKNFEIGEHEWEYNETTKNTNVVFLPQDDDPEVFEIAYGIGSGHRPAFLNDPERQLYRTNDLVRLHPTKPGHFKVVGRSDDQIMLSTGEKTNPGPLELIIGSHPAIDRILYFGRARFQNGILVRAVDSEDVDPENPESLAAYRNKIWPAVEKANEYAPSHSRIFKEMILVTRKPFALTPKATVSRAKTLELFDSDIDQIYETLANATASSVAVPDKFDEQNTIRYITTVVYEVMNHQLDPNKDLFEQGCDSLQATFIRARLYTAYRKVKTSGTLPGNWVYEYPTVTRMAKAFLERISGENVPENIDAQAEASKLEQYVQQYLKDLPAHKGSKPPPAKKTVLVTGTTGTLGSYLLHEYIQDPNVERVYAINRPSSKPGKERQASSWKDRGLDTTLLDSPKVVVVDADLAKPDFGIPATLYDELLQNVTLIVANSWRLDFNLPVHAFEPNMKGIQNLVHFALNSPFKEPPSIINSSSMGVLLNHPTGWVPEDKATAAWVPPQGYAQSKYIAERILEEAPVKVVNNRICQLAGSTVNGAWNTTDWVPLLVKSGERLGCLPDVKGPITFIPTDVGAKIIHDLSSNPDTPETVHMVHPKPIQWSDMINTVAKALGVAVVPYSVWLQKLSADDNAVANPALKLLPFWQSMDPRPAGPAHEALGTVRMRSDKAEGSSRTLASLTALQASHIEQWVAYWRGVGFLNT